MFVHKSTSKYHNNTQTARLLVVNQKSLFFCFRIYFFGLILQNVAFRHDEWCMMAMERRLPHAEVRRKQHHSSRESASFSALRIQLLCMCQQRSAFSLFVLQSTVSAGVVEYVCMKVVCVRFFYRVLSKWHVRRLWLDFGTKRRGLSPNEEAWQGRRTISRVLLGQLAHRTQFWLKLGIVTGN